MNRRHVTLLALLDLSAVLNKVDHKILLQRLETSFGITDSALINNWTTSTSFLRADSQRGAAELTIARRKPGRVV